MAQAARKTGQGALGRGLYGGLGGGGGCLRGLGRGIACGAAWQGPGISDELRAALNALSPLDRALMLERVLDGMDYAALARIHGLPAPYLRTRYSRAKAKLAAILKEGEHDDL